jgi:nicotinate-nucleotide pyrophosphorylase (carboxylating)
MDILTQVKPIIQAALAEDIGDGDVTAACTVPVESILKGRFIAKAGGIVAGLEVVRLTFWLLDEQIGFTPTLADGDPVTAGQVVATVSGSGRALLSGERVALNFLQRMAGIATLTRRFVEAVQGTGAIILDTRKTAPGLRLVDKWAVRLGGGQNHRFGLFDMALIKDNHIVAAGSISAAVERVRAGAKRGQPIEVEVKNLTELHEALELSLDRILLDNMGLDVMREAVRLANGRTPLEASGNITLENVAAVAATGVNYISVGALTHSVQALDVSFLLASGD